MFQKLKNGEDRLELIAEQLTEFEIKHPMIVFLIFWFALLIWFSLMIVVFFLVLLLAFKSAFILAFVMLFVFIFATLPIGYWIHIDNVR